MKKLFVVGLAILFFCGAPGVVFADPGLSQLQFDREKSSNGHDADSLDPLVLLEKAAGEPDERASDQKKKKRGQLSNSKISAPTRPEVLKKVQQKPEKPEVVSPPAVVQPNKKKVEELRKSLIAEMKKDAQETADSDKKRLVPSAKVRTDEGNKNKITTVFKWSSQEKEGCGRPLDQKNAHVKAHAISELLARLTGSDAFSEGICFQSCDQQGFIPMVESLAVVDMKGGSFTFVSDDAGMCSYVMEKAEGQDWPVLEVERFTCACAPLLLPR